MPKDPSESVTTESLTPLQQTRLLLDGLKQRTDAFLEKQRAANVDTTQNIVLRRKSSSTYGGISADVMEIRPDGSLKLLLMDNGTRKKSYLIQKEDNDRIILVHSRHPNTSTCFIDVALYDPRIDNTNFRKSTVERRILDQEAIDSMKVALGESSQSVAEYHSSKLQMTQNSREEGFKSGSEATESVNNILKDATILFDQLTEQN